MIFRPSPEWEVSSESLNSHPEPAEKSQEECDRPGLGGEIVPLHRAWGPREGGSHPDSASAEHVGSGLICQMAPGGDDLLGAESSLINFTASPRQKTGGSNSPAQAALMESAVTKEQSVIYDCL